MAVRVITELIDDLDGSAAVETVTFAYDGVEYTIDLSAKNATKLRRAFKPYAEKGVKVRPGRKRRSPGTDDQTTEGRARIRAWARQHMFGKFPNLGDRGRIPYEVVSAYNQAHGLRA